MLWEYTGSGHTLSRFDFSKTSEFLLYECGENQRCHYYGGRAVVKLPFVAPKFRLHRV